MKNIINIFSVLLILVLATTETYGQCGDYKMNLDLSPDFIIDLDKLASNAGFPDAKYPLAQVPNGCGPNDWRWVFVPGGFFGLADFTPACVCHDECYATNDKRSACDYKFYKSIEEVCLNAPHVNKKNCIRLAKIYYESVAENGSGPHTKARAIQLQYEDWVDHVIQLLGEYNFSGINPDGSRYGHGKCKISLSEGKLIFDWRLGIYSWKGWGILHSNQEITIQFSGAFSGSGTYKLNPDKSISGVWRGTGSVHKGTELLTRSN